jgi:hypothetical protein
MKHFASRAPLLAPTLFAPRRFAHTANNFLVEPL